MKVRFFKKIVSLIASFSILFNTLATPLAVIAQEVTPVPEPTPVETSTPDPTPEVTESPTTEPTVEPTENATVTPEVTVAPTEMPTETPTETPTEVATATSEATTEPTVEGASTESEETQEPTITTDKEDYHPGETATITGSLFNALQNLVLRVFGGSNEDGTYIESNYDVTADNLGSFTFNYLLDNIFRPLYTVQVLDTLGSLLAEKTFTDAPPPDSGNPSANLDQCANDPAPSPSTDGCSASANDWVNGNLGASKSSYLEGDSIPYRMLFDNLSTTGSHTVTFEWDTTKSGKHATDYLTSFDRTVTTANPCLGVSGCGSPFTFPIPQDTQVTDLGVTPISGDFTLYGGTINSASGYTLSGSYAGDSSTRITINFTATQGNPVLAWGGHIATREDWGPGSSAVSIPGSPYHMRLIDLDGSGGNQDRSLSAEAIIFPGTIRIVKDATPNGSTPFGFTGSPSPLTNFSLVDDGTSANTKIFSSIVDFKEYTINENSIPAGWGFDSVECDVTESNGGSASVESSTVTIDLKEGENYTCTYLNSLRTGTLNVIKHVINDNGGTATASAFSLHVKSGGNDVAGSPQAGSESGTSYNLNQGTYVVSEDTPPTGYTMTGFSGDCDSNGNVAVVAGQTKTCTITNDDQAGQLKIIKNTDGGDVTFDFTVTGPSASTPSILTTSGTGDTGFLSVNAGNYTVSETVLPGWDLTSSSCDSGTPAGFTIPNGGTVTCTFNNQKDANIIVVKQTLPDGDTQVFDFDLSYGDNDADLSDGQSDDSGDLDPGVYSVSENVPAGWDLTSATCDDDSDPSSINLEAGETVTCTFINTKRAHIIVVKDVIGNPDPTDFTFTNNFGNNNPSEFMLDEDTNGDLPSSRNFEVLPGKYSVSENPLDHWQLESATCNQDETVDDIDVAPGETVTCTFVNEELISITLVKNTIGGNGEFDFNMTGDGLPSSIKLTTVAGTDSEVFEDLDQDDSFSITEVVPTGWALDSAVCTGGEIPSNITPEIGEDVTCTFTNGKLPTLTLEKTVTNDNGGTATEADFQGKVNGNNVAWDAVTTLSPGNYIASEEANVSGYAPSEWGTNCATDGTVTLAYGDTKVCSITNDDIAPTLKLVKVVTNNDGGNAVAGDWDLTATGDSGFTDDGGTGGFHTVLAGEGYALSETSVTGYSQTGNWVCDGGNLDGSTVTLDLDEDVTCTVTNNDIAPRLTLTKVVTVDNGGTAEPDDFDLTVGGTGVLSGVTNSYIANTPLALNETLVPGYSFVDLTGDPKCPGVLGGTVTLDEGEHVSCTITNDDNEPSLILRKVVVNNNGGEAVESDWTLTATGPTGFSGTGPSVSNGESFDAGSYDLSESGPAGYSASDWVCEGGDQVDGNTVTVGLGENVVCTITNDDIAPKLHLRKIVTNDDGGDAILSDFTLKADGTDENDLEGTSPVDSDETLKADTFVLSEETTVGGYTASEWECEGGVQEGSNITLGINEEATCTITNNDDVPQLKLVKQVIVDNGGDATADNWMVSAETEVVDFTDRNFSNLGGSNSFEDVYSGVGYVLSESGGPDGYGAGDWECDKVGALNGDVVTLELGDQVTCTIVNDDIAPKLHLRKVVITDNDGVATVDDFTLTADGTDTNDLSGISPVDSDETLLADTFVLGETSVTGYSASDWVCVGGDQENSSITVGVGEEATCTITNNDISPRLTVIKHVINDDGDIAVASDFTMEVAGTNVSDPSFPGDEAGVTVTLNAGSYSVDEANDAGYVKILSADCSGTIAVGESKTCTITNDDRPHATRTQGFWQTHTVYTTSVFGTNNWEIGNHEIDTTSKLFAGFYASISKLSNGKTKRTALDQARMQMLQQWLATKLNCEEFGCSGTTQTLLTNAATAWAGTNINTIRSFASQLDAYNNSNDALPISGQGKATPKDSQGLAGSEFSFWDVLP